MKGSDLHREWARVLDMCEGTGVDVQKCVRLIDSFTGDILIAKFSGQPLFDCSPDSYIFAVAILEDKPVFAGDLIYHKIAGIPYKVRWCDGLIRDNEWTWNQPKKIYILKLSEKHIKILSGDYDKPTFKDLSDIRNLANIALKESTGNGE